MIKPAEFIHPEDAAALRQLENIPGFPAIAKKVLELGYEKLKYGLNMASTIRLSPTQLPELYRHLPPICERLGIKEPEFYLEMNPVPNAYTSGEVMILPHLSHESSAFRLQYSKAYSTGFASEPKMPKASSPIDR